jgi:hypothetical protein
MTGLFVLLRSLRLSRGSEPGLFARAMVGAPNISPIAVHPLQADSSSGGSSPTAGTRCFSIDSSSED